MNGAWDFGRLRIAWGSIEGVEAPVEPPRRWRSRCRRCAPVALSICVVATLAMAEFRSSWLSSRFLSAVGRRLTSQLHPGVSGARLRAPRGPYDERLGVLAAPGFSPTAFCRRIRGGRAGARLAVAL